jgi:hypothetical protein
MYTVRRLREPLATAGTAHIDADDHRDADACSSLAEPGAELIVSDGRIIIRYRVDQLGRIVEQSRYTA